MRKKARPISGTNVGSDSAVYEWAYTYVGHQDQEIEVAWRNKVKQTQGHYYNGIYHKMVVYWGSKADKDLFDKHLQEAPNMELANSIAVGLNTLMEIERLISPVKENWSGDDLINIATQCGVIREIQDQRDDITAPIADLLAMIGKLLRSLDNGGMQLRHFVDAYISISSLTLESQESNKRRAAAAPDAVAMVQAPAGDQGSDTLQQFLKERMYELASIADRQQPFTKYKLTERVKTLTFLLVDTYTGDNETVKACRANPTNDLQDTHIIQCAHVLVTEHRNKGYLK